MNNAYCDGTNDNDTSVAESVVDYTETQRINCIVCNAWRLEVGFRGEYEYDYSHGGSSLIDPLSIRRTYQKQEQSNFSVAG